MSPRNVIVLVVSLFCAGCDERPDADDDAEHDTSAPIGAEETPMPPNPPPWPSSAYCDATPLEGVSCECEGYALDILTHQGEVVASGEDPLSLRIAGTGAFAVFGVCGDSYLWEEGGPGCMLTVQSVDRGCDGIALSHVPDLGDGASACPLVPDGALVATCSHRDEPTPD